MSIEALRERIQAAQKPKQGRRKTFTPPTMADFADGCVLAFDQTLTKTGWALVEFNSGRLMIHAGGMLVPPKIKELKGFEETYAKAAILHDLVRDLGAMPLPASARWAPEVWVHEMPAVQGYRLESSLMAGREIRRVANKFPSRPSVMMISRQHAYSVLVGAPSIDKAAGTQAINALVPDYLRSTERWNQDVHDASLLGATYLYDKKRVIA